MSKSIEERIEFLEKCANLYETSGNSSITDAEYDREFAACQKIDPDNPFFSKVGGWDEEHIYGTPFTHKYSMGSLNKDPNPEEFEKWFAKTHPDTHDLIAILDLKVDGCSLCLHYENGKIVRVVTRGDGKIGIDVTPNAKYINGVKKSIKEKGSVEIKGECYKDRKDFYENWVGDYENPRNFTSGSLNQKDPLVTKERGLSFVAYEVRGKEFATETRKVLFLEEQGFETLQKYVARIECRGRTAQDVARAVRKYMDKIDRSNLPFTIDGIVFKLNDIKVAEAMGTTDSEGRRPKANRAVKFPTAQKETVLEGIEWSIGRTGSLTPVGLLKPVRLAETTVQRVSLHNLKELKRLGITHYGCMVLVEKAGDIIPKVIRKTQDGPETDKIKVSKYCPLCKTEMQWDNTKTTVWCHNKACPAVINGSIEHWFKKIGVKGIGEGIIKKLTAKSCQELDPFVSSISEMYLLADHEEELSEEFGRKAFSNILKSIDSVKEVTLAKFIEALGIGKVGTTAKDITAIAPTVKDIDALKVSDLVKIDGFAQTKAESFVNGWKDMRGEIDNILNYVSVTEVNLASNKLEGKKFCFTGSFSNPSRGEMEQMVEDNGGKKSSVSKNLTALVWDEAISGSKIDKAKELGITIIAQKEFLEMIK